MNAETQSYGLERASGSVLQWGRVLMNAETRHLAAVPVLRYDWLQWGRVLMNAETGCSSIVNGFSIRFNGAAFS